MNFKLFSVLAFVSIVAAQSGVTTPTASGTDGASMEVPSAAPTGGPGAQIPTCVQDCITGSGCDPTDFACLCTTGIQSITDCVTSSCSPEDQDAASALQGTLCGASGGMSGAMNSTMVTGSATTMGMNSTSLSVTESSSSAPSLSVPRTTPSPTLTPRPLSTGTPTSSSTSAGAATSTNAAAPQNIVAQGVWVMVASLIGLAVAA